ncbi:MAG: DegT/DnrJ/EryC1/StrS family aminotransferase [Pseudomonadota bacterium]
MIKPFYLDLTEIEIQNIQDKLGEILRGGTLILGKYTQTFENEFAKYIGTKYAVSLNTCTSALEVLLVLNGARGKKVAVPTNTNFATVAAIIRAGGLPIYMDMTNDHFVPSLEILKYTMNKHKEIRGVVWVHIGGVIAPDFAQIVEYCKLNSLFLIEDAAHAHGSQLSGIRAGNFADGGAFSFFPTKVMTTVEGGMITTNNIEHAELAKSYRNQGKRGGNYGGLHYDLGNSWRLTEISAYIGLVQLAKLDSMLYRRQRAVEALIPTLKHLGIDYVDVGHMDRASHYKFIIKYTTGQDVESVKKRFNSEGIILGGGVYEVPCHLQPVFENIPYDKRDLQASETYCPKHVCPPITSGTTEQDVAKIAQAIEEILKP